MQLIPAVDVLGDDAVRLEQGDYDRVLFREPLDDFIARIVATSPSLVHVVDLQGARDGALRPEVIERCRRSAQGTPLQVSGGIRSLASARAALDAGAQRVIVGTALWTDDGALEEFVSALGDQLVAALDVRDGQIAVRGWRASSGLSFAEALEQCVHARVTRVHVTAIDRDGTMRGPDLELYEEACRSGILVVAAGGVRDDDDVEALGRVGCEAAVMGVGYLRRIANST
jgi:phosphoribosylformimino-5-aminoimidazole carboxamide ribotide isomerase